MGEELSNDDIDALLAGNTADSAQPESKTTVSNDDIDALLAGAGGGVSSDASSSDNTVSNEEIDALLAGNTAGASQSESKTTVSNDDIDALLAGAGGGGTSTDASATDNTVSNDDIAALFAENAPSDNNASADSNDTTVSNDDMAALLGSIEGMTDTSADKEQVPQKILDLVDSAIEVGCSAWQTLLNKDVKQTRTNAEIGNPAASLEGKDLIGSTIAITGDIEGTLYLTYSKAGVSRAIGSMLMETDDDIVARADKEFDDEDKDAFGEAINQWGGAVSQAWRDALGCNISFGPCELSYGATFMQLLLPGKGAAIINFDFSIGDSEESPAWMCLDSKLVEALNPPEKEDPVVTEDPIVESVTTNAPPSQPEEQSDILGENIDAVLSIEVPVRVIIAEKKMSMSGVREITTGSIIEFDKNCEEVLDVYIGNQMMGRGEVIIRRERFGVQVKEVLSLEERIRMLGT